MSAGRLASEPARSCVGCRYWSAYLPTLGECLEPLVRWQAGFSRAEDPRAYRAEHPKPCAFDCAPEDTCARFEARP